VGTNPDREFQSGESVSCLWEAPLPSNIVSIYPKGWLARHLVGKLDLSSCLSTRRYARKEVRIENSKYVGVFFGKFHSAKIERHP
jgi:hypothetical protein